MHIQQTEPAPGALSGALAEIEAVLGRARQGDVGDDDALAHIERIVRRRATQAETYQKPLG